MARKICKICEKKFYVGFHKGRPADSKTCSIICSRKLKQKCKRKWDITHKDKKHSHNKKYREGHKAEISQKRLLKKDILNKRKREWYQKNKKGIRIYNKKWRQSNPQYSKEWKTKNKEKVKLWSKSWAARNKKKRVFYQQTREWRKRNGGSFNWGDWESLKAQYNWTCPACNKKEPEIKLTPDHIIPLSRGGMNNIENIQPLCVQCNCRKYTKIIFYGFKN